jgi:hypothetical protein
MMKYPMVLLLIASANVVLLFLVLAAGIFIQKVFPPLRAK